MDLDLDASRKVWLVTGTSSGFGKRLVKSILARGDYVIATVRALDRFQIPLSDEERCRVHVLVFDLADTHENIQKLAAKAAGLWGRIDVLVNNAGVAPKSLLEELGESTLSSAFQTNFFGVLNLTNAILPYMRARRSGTVVFMGSRSVFKPDMPLTGAYVASKAALHGAAETYSSELKPFGVRVLIACFGGFRTEGIHIAPVTVDNPAPGLDDFRQKAIHSFDGAWERAPGDPDKAMEVLVDAVRGEGKAKGRDLPLYLFIGGPTYTATREHCRMLLKSMDEWEDVAKDLDFDCAAPVEAPSHG
ncbi:hypothetical protein POSPLADRAFT_1069886 [Postia placenta MAD-698-R-SB12]|uniref:Uncharacterized protein n=1 Tax=Postia placenta MAD-698-R-SB12 TaxID=670580 RepID=A0A1X6N526_9APHY|nr:hypothetical protein POSPLADRAFT_1069886 [Postia placenta MAD-698-R-SB12]OSX63704.1 hypothetical protein POSPLADRAFT_1069886 [Postia placenta MAD-698-R-SB12]